jgi:iron(III) transport system ATP-binding protein
MEGGSSRALVVEDLARVFQDRGSPFRAVDQVSFEVASGEFYTLLGPSGCGKTTTLRCVAGLDPPDAGRISVGGQTVSAPGVFVPPHRRDIGMVFQSYAIWPHMTVFENVAFPLRVGTRSINGAEVRRQVEEALEMVELGGLDRRQATQLSGGQQQRLALARALVRRPQLLLLDEPLSNLDARLRDRMRLDLRRLQRRLAITAVYVTHDQAEALSMSDRVAVMQNGRIIQEGTPREIYQNPASRFVADFVGSSNFLEATALRRAAGRLWLDTPVGEIEVPAGSPAAEHTANSVFIRPENVILHLTPVQAPNVYPGRLEEVTFLGEHMDCRVEVAGANLTTRQHPSLQAEPGDTVYVELPPGNCSVIP